MTTSNNNLLLDRRLLIVTGKGGVGKSTIAAALAWSAVASGKRVLGCDLDAKGDLAACFVGAGSSGAPPLEFTPREHHSRLWLMAMDPEASLKEYLRINLHIPFVTRVGALSAAFDFLANAAPGVREIVTIGKIAYEVRERHYDLVVVDATATGHVLGQLRAPEAINELVGAGAIRSQTKWMLDILNDPATTGVVAVTTPEELPVSETIELAERIARETRVDLAAVVVNRVLPTLFTAKDEMAFTKLAGGRQVGLRKAVGGVLRVAADAVDDASVAALAHAAELSLALNRRRRVYLEQLIAAVNQPVLFVPELFDARPGLAATRRIADHLGDELET